MGTETTAEGRRDAVASNLLPIMRIADQPLRWTMEERLGHYACPGVAVAVLREGRLDWADGFGARTAGGTEPVGADTTFMVASCSKPVTALLVLQQVERGVVDLDVDVNRYLRRWQVPHNEFTAEQPVTLRHALSHTAGLTVNGWGITAADGQLPTPIDLLDGRPPSNQPPVIVDKRYDGDSRYSGGGYVIAQLVLEDVLGRPFDEIAREHLFGPLGMTRSSFTQRIPAALLEDGAAGHGDDGRPMPLGSMAAADMGAGGLCSTARDYATFLLACGAAFRGEPSAVLGRELAQEMMSRHGGTATFGLGFRVLGDDPHRRVNHGGSNDGYQTETNLYPGSGDGAVVFTNATSGLFLFREVFNGIADVYDWPDFMPAPKRLARLTPEELDRYSGSYRIVSGIEMPLMKVWTEGGRLYNQVPGLRFGIQEVFCAEDGTLFNQTGPFETRVTFGPDGSARELHVTEGDVTVLRAERVAD